MVFIFRFLFFILFDIVIKQSFNYGYFVGS